MLVEQTIALMNFAGLSDNAYHKIRLYAKKVWNIDFGVLLTYLNQYLQRIIPSDDVCTETEPLQVGSVESSSDKRYQDCTYFYVKGPWDLIANRVQYLISRGIFQHSSEFCNLDDDVILTVSNVDKASARTSVMV